MAQAFPFPGQIPLSHARSYYQEVQIKTADNLELVLILYRGVIDQLKQAREYLVTDQVALRFAAVDKALAMVGELRASLNFENGKDIAKSLDRLYDYIIRRLMNGNIQRDTRPFDEAIRLFSTLYSGWEEAQLNSNREGKIG